jgi:hypothetical protein
MFLGFVVLTVKALSGNTWDSCAFFPGAIN